MFCRPMTEVLHDPIRTLALEKLEPRLPASIALYRRLQGPSNGVVPKIYSSEWLAAYVPSETLSSPDDGASPQIEVAINGGPWVEPWLIAYVSRESRPETELYMYGSWETDDHVEIAPEKKPAIDALLRRFLEQLRIDDFGGAPPSVHEQAIDYIIGTGNLTEYNKHMADPKVMLWGAIHESTKRMLEDGGWLASGYAANHTKNHTFLFEDVERIPPITRFRDLATSQTVDMSGVGEHILPPPLVYGKLPESQLDEVIASTSIPRQRRTLRSLPSEAILHNGVAVAWAFLGLDGSVSSLYVKPEYRGRHLGQALAKRVLGLSLYGQSMSRMAQLGYAHVTEGNSSSVAVFSQLGGQDKWWSYWLRISLRYRLADITPISSVSPPGTTGTPHNAETDSELVV